MHPGLQAQPVAWVSSVTSHRVGVCHLPAELFAQPIRLDILQRAVEWERSRARADRTAVKNRSQVRGSGRKPHPQKGTGRARQGSIRSPINRGGGKAHAPPARSFAIDIQKKLRRLALKVLLSTKLLEDRIIILDSTKLNSPRAKPFRDVVKSLGTDSFLLVDREDGTDSSFLMASGNFEHIQVIKPSDLLVTEAMRKRTLVITKEGLEDLELWLSTHPVHRYVWRSRVNSLKTIRTEERRTVLKEKSRIRHKRRQMKMRNMILKLRAKKLRFESFPVAKRKSVPSVQHYA